MVSGKAGYVAVACVALVVIISATMQLSRNPIQGAKEHGNASQPQPATAAVSSHSLVAIHGEDTPAPPPTLSARHRAQLVDADRRASLPGSQYPPFRDSINADNARRKLLREHPMEYVLLRNTVGDDGKSSATHNVQALVAEHRLTALTESHVGNFVSGDRRLTAEALRRLLGEAQAQSASGNSTTISLQRGSRHDRGRRKKSDGSDNSFRRIFPEQPIPKVFAIPSYKLHGAESILHHDCELVLVTYCDKLKDDANRAMLRAFAMSAAHHKRKYLVTASGALSDDDLQWLKGHGFVTVFRDEDDTLHQYLRRHSPNQQEGPKKRAFLKTMRGYFGRFDISSLLLRRKEFMNPATLCHHFVLYVDLDVTLHGEPLRLREVAGTMLPVYASVSPEYTGGWTRVLTHFKTQVDANTGVMLLNLPAMAASVASLADYTAHELAQLNESTVPVFSTFDQAYFNEYYGGLSTILDRRFNWRALYGPTADMRLLHYQGFKCKDILCTEGGVGLEEKSFVAHKKSVELSRVGVTISCEGGRNARHIIDGVAFTRAQGLAGGAALCRHDFIHENKTQLAGISGGFRKSTRGRPKNLMNKECAEPVACTLRTTACPIRDPLPPALLHPITSPKCTALLPWVTLVVDFSERSKAQLLRSVKSAVAVGVPRIVVVLSSGSHGEDEVTPFVRWCSSLPIDVVWPKSWQLTRLVKHPSMLRLELGNVLIAAGVLQSAQGDGWCRTPFVFFAEPGVIFNKAPRQPRGTGRKDAVLPGSDDPIPPPYFAAVSSCPGRRWAYGLSVCFTDISTRAMLVNVYGLASALPSILHYIKYELGRSASSDRAKGKTGQVAAYTADTFVNEFFGTAISQLPDAWGVVLSCVGGLKCLAKFRKDAIAVLPGEQCPQRCWKDEAGSGCHAVGFGAGQEYTTYTTEKSCNRCVGPTQTQPPACKRLVFKAYAKREMCDD